ncbi:poly A polymerase C-terminal region-like protein [Coniochaeta ligniaria NRRL 30616]|uniref:Poly A polymerase C-terminal region-like protein n=1 Tax=Coniochaeta ligniaria NRRL 30616 TaxID=1408157 RepID=A0A1J7JXD0_9PEZI|nr:poly A polymerase C-terminal region-like protein [Coniochaeta ligniaria NRRL 30616]
MDSDKALLMAQAAAEGRTIELTPREKQLKNLLVDVARRIDATPANPGEKKPDEPLVLRWAGGWVRDKLLGIESHDIDTAINNMTGEAFAKCLAKEAYRPEVQKAHSLSQGDVGRLYTVAKNPEKSKHLETSSLNLCGLDVDFVNLRKETYTADSRNPQMEFGTAEEDALRRDATVNALFYNLMTEKIEDFTGGLRDMEAKLIRTPMEPFQTFTDDPLRVLRLIRFASRLEFSIDPEVEAMMGDTRVLDALRLKISRERVGIELEKMLKGNHPCESLRLIDRLGLYHTVFTDPARTDMPEPDISNWHAAYEALDTLAARKTPGSIYHVLVRSDEAAYFAWQLSAVVPFEQLPDEESRKPGKPPIPWATQANRGGLMSPTKLTDVITAAHRHRLAILELKNAVRDKAPYVRERERFGMAIREWDFKGGHWKLQVLYALLFEVMERTGEGAKAGKDGAATREEIFMEWQGFLDHLEELDVMDAPAIKRLVDGTQLAKALGVKPGKWMAAALEVVMRWQLQHVGETDPAGAIEEVKARKEELDIP